VVVVAAMVFATSVGAMVAPIAVVAVVAAIAVVAVVAAIAVGAVAVTAAVVPTLIVAVLVVRCARHESPPWCIAGPCSQLSDGSPERQSARTVFKPSDRRPKTAGKTSTTPPASASYRES